MNAVTQTGRRPGRRIAEPAADAGYGCVDWYVYEEDLTVEVRKPQAAPTAAVPGLCIAPQSGARQH